MAPLVRRLTRTSWSELRLLLQAARELIVAWVALRLRVPRIEAKPPLGKPSTRAVSQTQIAWAIEAVARRIPGASCLVQGMACRRLLAKYGYDSELRIGVSPEKGSKIKAHAWIECKDTVLLGGKGSPRDYVGLGAIDAGRSRPE